MTESHITLYSEASERFEEIKQDMAQRRGWEPSNAEVVKRMMEEWPDHPTIKK
jgi:hypothetical protein